MIDRTPPWIIGHRGVAGEALENSLPSLLRAVDQHADMIELDVQLTGDGELAVFHDWDLERLAGQTEVVEESSLERLVELFDAISTLDEVFEALPTEQPLNVELKRRHARPQAFAERLAVALSDRPRILLSSFDWRLLEAARAVLPDRPVAPLGNESGPDLLEAAARLDAWSVNCHHDLADHELIEGANRPVLVYTVNDHDQARALFDRGVAGVFTDIPGALRRELGL